MERVVLFKNGTVEDGKVVSLVRSEELLSIASCKFGFTAKSFYTAKGAKIEDFSCIRDDDVLFVSGGEPFIAVDVEASAGKLSLCDKASVPSEDSDWVLLNVGGEHFATTRNTLVAKEPKSMLARMFASENGSHCWSNKVDKHGAFLIDRSPVYFAPLLNYLRHGQLIIDKHINPQGVLEEAKFFGIETVIPVLESLVKEERTADQLPLTRHDVVRTLISTSCISELRFQGVNLAEADLSRLDLRHINFKYANLKNVRLCGANLSYCCLERTDLSKANLEGAILHGVKMLCANLEGANLKSCNMEDPTGNKANMEGVNLKGANLEGSQMAGVNLRVATLKKANLQNCDLRGAVLAGADLESCDLSGSDLHEANLRGANLKDATFELMLTPLHMSQAIR